ncbi:MAG: DJ-1/PfpI family protein [Clostridia bacterium]|nr:DJ-1/PfpI family protein [Clostridia bacterium]
MVYVLLADGFEEVEAICPIDVLRRGGIGVRTVGVTGREVRGSHGLILRADLSADEAVAAARREPPEMLVLPGGMPGTRNLDAWAGTDEMIAAVEAGGGFLAAICAAPSVLGKRGKLAGRRACCYPGFEDMLKGAEVSNDPVTRDGKIVTSRGAGCAMKFALALLAALKGEAAAEETAKAVIYE